MKRFSLFLIILFFTIGCSNLKPTDILNSFTPSNGYEVTEYAYGNDERQKLDVYIPKKRNDKPPIVFVYGGAWKDGNKNDYKFVAQALTGVGYTVIIPDYRLYPAVRFPAFIDDVADAIQYSNQHATQVLGRPMTAYILMGHSAGAHTVALLATDLSYLQKRKINAALTAVIAISGPYDLDLKDPEVIPIFAGATAQQAKPLANVHSGMAPMLLMHGEDDKRVLPFHTVRFAKAVTEAGNLVETRLYKGVDHVRIIASLGAPLRFLNNSYKDIKDFLEEVYNEGENEK